jgi:hypothetical protein
MHTPKLAVLIYSSSAADAISRALPRSSALVVRASTASDVEVDGIKGRSDWRF